MFLEIHACLQPAPPKGIQDSLGFWNSTPWIPDSKYWIADSNRKWDSGFHELYSRFQSPGLWIPQAKISPINQMPKAKFPGFRNQKSLTWGDNSASKSTRKEWYLLISSKSFSLFLPGSIMTNNEVDLLWRISNNTPDLFK